MINYIDWKCEEAYNTEQIISQEYLPREFLN
jgi:hypothetical protein